MGLSDKYGRVTVERVRTDPIGDDEPVAVFRAKDRLAVEVLDHYHRLCEIEGASDEHLASIGRQIEAVEDWCREHPDEVRTPGANA